MVNKDLIQLALQEDLGYPFFDLTTETLFANNDFPAQAKIISKHETPFVFCGTPLVNELLSNFPTVTANFHINDGDLVSPGATVLNLQGSIKLLLQVERTLLNFIQHLSAVATTTHAFVTKVQHTKLKILDTRKTTPGFRRLDKYAVYCGGGVNHRIGLYDALLIKDNHIDALGGIPAVLERLPSEKKHHTVIEIRTQTELQQVLDHGLNKIDRVLLDNMSVSELRTCATLCQDKLPTEASGNVNLETIVPIAETGVDFASVGKLTHSFAHIDLSMLFEK